jgi:putative transposase
MRHSKWLSKADLRSIPKNVRQIVLNVISLAHFSLIHSRSWAANSPIERVRLAAQRDQAIAKATQGEEISRVKDARMARTPAHHRANYLSHERQFILETMTARGWAIAQTARVFLLDPDTIASWLKRLDDDTLLQTAVPVNKLSDLVRYIVQRLKILCPLLGKKRIAHLLTIAGMKISVSSVGRFIKNPIKPKPPTEEKIAGGKPGHVVTAKHPNHVWHIDLTVVPTSGFRAAWPPFSLPQCWPFAYWVAIIIDHFSRKVIGFAVFNGQPDSIQIRSFIGRAIHAVGKTPKYIISDKGTQFWCHAFKNWCKRKHIRPRYGAVGKYGSIAIIERLIRSLKSECTRRIIVPMRQADMRYELGFYFTWYNEFRPHQGIKGKIPQEIYSGIFHAPPKLNIRDPNLKLNLHVAYMHHRPHLPIITLKRAA